MVRVGDIYSYQYEAGGMSPKNQNKEDRRTRRSWTVHEEKLLAQSFKEIIELGWKGPNGFRSGFFLQLEQRMRKAMPGTDLRGEPHISSKYASWNKAYKSIAQCLESKGFSWDSRTHSVEASTHLWDELLKVFPKLASVRGRPFPLYKAWIEIYSKHQAAGEIAIDQQPAAAEVEPIEADHAGNIQETEENSTPPTQIPDKVSAEAVEFANTHKDGPQSSNATHKTSSRHGSDSGSGSKKRKTGMDPTDEELLEYISGFCASVSASIDKNQKQNNNDIKKTRRSWTMHEENLLAKSFKEIIALGWKTPGGFRTGFLFQLEQRMREVLPGTDLRSEPHISSKYGSWKKTFTTIAQCLGSEGFTWNSRTHTVDASPHVWDKVLQSSPKLASIRRKPFPLYNSWVEIFSKDVVTGEIALNPPEAEQEQDAPVDIVHHENIEETEENSVREVPNEEDGTQSWNATPKPSSRHGSGSNKRKRADETLLVEAVYGLSASMDKLASRIGWEIDESRRRGELYEAIGRLKMSSITMNDQIKVSYKLAMNSKAMDMFFGLPDGAKVRMVRMLIEGKLK